MKRLHVGAIMVLAAVFGRMPRCQRTALCPRTAMRRSRSRHRPTRPDWRFRARAKNAAGALALTNLLLAAGYGAV